MFTLGVLAQSNKATLEYASTLTEGKASILVISTSSLFGISNIMKCINNVFISPAVTDEVQTLLRFQSPTDHDAAPL